MDRAVTLLDELLNLSLVAKNTFRGRSFQERLSEFTKFPSQTEETHSFALEKATENYAFTNKTYKSIEIKYKKGTSTFLSGSSDKDGFRTQNNEHFSLNSLTDSSSCFYPSCSRVNLLSEGSNVLKALAPHEGEAQFANRLSYRHRRLRLQFRTQIPASNKKKLERVKADWLQPINCFT